MLDVIFILLMFVFTGVTFLWIAACDHLLRTDSTLDAVEAEHTRSWSSAPARGQGTPAQ